MSDQLNLKISASQAEINPDVLLLRLDGVLDTLTSPQLEGVVSRLLSQDRFKLVVDLAGVDYISSAGWGIFIAHLKDLRDRNGDLKLARMLPEVREVFELLEFDTVIKSYDNLEHATGDFSGTATASLQHPVAKAVEGFQPKVETGSKPIAKSDTGKTVTKTPLTDKVLVIVQEDPLLRISEIRDTLDTSRFGRVRASRLRVFFILLSHKLLRLRSRCNYARQRGKVFGSHSDTI